jgi:4-amino-4-deoxy-L-arabinose transferase-like glycosyltransferase
MPERRYNRSTVGKKTLSVLLLVVFIPSLLIRLHPTTSESFQYDAVMSQIAARDGAVANALDTSRTFETRRNHPPLLAYIIELNNRIFGDGPLGARIFSIVFGSLTCLVVAIAVAALLPPVPIRLPAAITAGWLLCVLPVHLYVSRTSNWDAVYGFFATSSLVCMASYALHGQTQRLYAAALFGALAFLTCELGLSLLPAAGFVVLMDALRMRRSSAVLRWALIILFVGALFMLLWPAGFLKLDLGRTLLYRWRDSAGEPRNLPWYVFYTELFSQSPAFTLCMVLGIAVTLLVPVARTDLRTKFSSRVLVAALPFWIYTATALVLSLKERLVYVHHIVDMFPPLVIAVSMELAARANPRGESAKRWALGIGAAAVALSAVAAFNPDPEVVGPQEHPGFLGVSEALGDYPGARVYCYDTTVLGFYLPHASIEGGPTRFWTPDDVVRAKRGKYDFVVFDRAKLDKDYPNAEQLVDALAPEYHLKWVIEHRRTKEPVAWVLAPGP